MGGVEANDRIRTTTSSSLVNEWIPKSTNDIYIVSHISLPTNKQKMRLQPSAMANRKTVWLHNDKMRNARAF